MHFVETQVSLETKAAADDLLHDLGGAAEARLDATLLIVAGSGCWRVHRVCSTGGYDQDVAGAIDEEPGRSGARPRPVIALSIATATWLAIAPMRYRSAVA